MKRQIINVPKGIRYISEWREKYNYTLPNYPCIINKSITGCGFTEECIRNSENVILCSPRKMLLENKESQHLGEVYYVQNKYEKVLEIDKDLTAPIKANSSSSIVEPENNLTSTNEESKLYHINMLNSIKDYVYDCQVKNKPCKLLVTYDSFRIIKEALLSINCLDNFRVIIDEFQSIFTDSKFKSGTELEFVYHLQGIDKVCFVSATPMMEKYLNFLDEFRNLPYIIYNWSEEDPMRVLKPELKVRSCSGESIQSIAKNIITKYLNEDFEVLSVLTKDGKVSHISSKEAVFYVNSVKNICDIIKLSNLRPDQVNILCSNTPSNSLKIQKFLKSKRYTIGKVPVLGEDRKMFTFCTRTVYLGADFYSDNARSFIFSDANISCMAVDITLDLPQILGRQRLLSNPWKNRAELYVKLLMNKNQMTRETFEEYIKKKTNETYTLLKLYSSEVNASPDVRFSYAVKLLKDTKISNYKDDYVAVNQHTGKGLEPVFNKLVMIAEQRAFEIEQLDYLDRVSVFSALEEEGIKVVHQDISNFLSEFYKFTHFPDKMKLLCERSLSLSESDLNNILIQIPGEYGKYLVSLGIEKIKACSYIKAYLEKAYKKFTYEEGNELIKLIYREFKEGEIISSKDLKIKLLNIYSSSNNPHRAKATDIKKYFKIKLTKLSTNGKQVEAYKLIKKLK